MGCVWRVYWVTMPKLFPPPFRAANKSDSVSSLLHNTGRIVRHTCVGWVIGMSDCSISKNNLKVNYIIRRSAVLRTQETQSTFESSESSVIIEPSRCQDAKDILQPRIYPPTPTPPNLPPTTVPPGPSKPILSLRPRQSWPNLGRLCLLIIRNPLIQLLGHNQQPTLYTRKPIIRHMPTRLDLKQVIGVLQRGDYLRYFFGASREDDASWS